MNDNGMFFSVPSRPDISIACLNCQKISYLWLYKSYLDSSAAAIGFSFSSLEVAEGY